MDEKSYVELMELKNNCMRKKNFVAHNENCLCDHMALSSTIAWAIFVAEVHHCSALLLVNKKKEKKKGKF